MVQAVSFKLHPDPCSVTARLMLTSEGKSMVCIISRIPTEMSVIADCNPSKLLTCCLEEEEVVVVGLKVVGLFVVGETVTRQDTVPPSEATLSQSMLLVLSMIADVLLPLALMSFPCPAVLPLKVQPLNDNLEEPERVYTSTAPPPQPAVLLVKTQSTKLAVLMMLSSPLPKYAAPPLSFVATLLLKVHPVKVAIVLEPM
mmetsp:Transcript_2250/g.4511  ORF Transcript_2250/g.4511 Transcript_2250/m.4511 type:complete len:200 (+) Transcript_2250:581-1180(+)